MNLDNSVELCPIGTILDFTMMSLTCNFRDEFLGPVSLIIILSYIHSISSCKKLLGPVLRQSQVCHTRGLRERERENTKKYISFYHAWVHMKILFLLSPCASQFPSPNSIQIWNPLGPICTENDALPSHQTLDPPLWGACRKLDCSISCISARRSSILKVWGARDTTGTLWSWRNSATNCQKRDGEMKRQTYWRGDINVKYKGRKTQKL